MDTPHILFISQAQTSCSLSALYCHQEGLKLHFEIYYSACSDITEKHRRLAEITEMIHTASLMHDDVVDESPTRRGQDRPPFEALLSGMRLSNLGFYLTQCGWLFLGWTG